MNPTQLQAQLLEMRTNAGLSRKDVAKKTGFSERVIQYWEDQQRSIKWISAVKLLAVYGIEVKLEAK